MAQKTVPASEAVVRNAGHLSQVVRVFGELRFHADGPLVALAFGPDGRLWSVEDPGVLRQWNPDDGRPLGWTFLTDLATSWAFSADARLLAAAGEELTLWDVPSGQLLTVLPQPSWVTAIAMRQSSTWLATGHDDGVSRLWDSAGQHLVREFAGHDLPVSAVAFSPDGRRLATAGEDRVIRIWELKSGRLLGTLEGHTDRIQSLAWHPRGRRLVSAGWDTTARLWDTGRFEPIILLNAHADQLSAMAFSPDGTRLACADSAKALYVWDADTARILHCWREHKEEIGCVAFSGDGRRLASGSTDGLIRLWDAGQGLLLSGPADAVPDRSGLTISPDGTRLASTCGGVGLQAWDTASGQRLLEIADAGHFQVLGASPDGKWLASGGTDTLVRLWKADSGQAQAVFEGQAGQATALAFTLDGMVLASASGSDGLVWLWDVPGGQPRLVIPEAADSCIVTALAFHPGSRLLAVGGIDWMATGGTDGVVRLWDVAEPGLVSTIPHGALCLAFHPSGKWLAGAGPAGVVHVWDLQAPQQSMTLAGHEKGPTCVAYSPNGRWLASGSDERTVRLWDAVTGEPLGCLEVDTQIKGLGFSPDSRFLFSGNANTTSYQFEVRRLLQCKPPTGDPHLREPQAAVQLPRHQGLI